MKSYLKIWIIVLSLFLPGAAIVVEQQTDMNLGKKKGALCVMRGKGLCQVDGVKLQMMDFKAKSPRVLFPKTVNSIVTTSTHVFAQSGNVVYSCGSRLQKVFTFENDCFLMFPCANEDSMYVVGFSGFTSTIYRCCPDEHSIEMVNRVDEDIVYVCDTGDGMVVVTKEKVYVRDGEKWTKQLSFFENINSATYTSKGLVLASDNYIVLVVEKDRVAILSEVGCKQLLSDRNVLYVVDYDDNILRFEL